MTTGFKDYFSGESDRYREFRPVYPKELFDYLSSIVPATELALDCATGSGQAAVALADYFQAVIATDASESQVANAARRQNISYRVEPAERTSVSQGLVDLVTVAQAVHWFDTSVFGQEVTRVLKPGGILAVWSYGLCHITPEIDEIIYELYEHTVGDYWPPERKLVEERYQSINFEMPQITAPEIRMHAEWDIEQVTGYLKTWSAVRRYTESGKPDPVENSGLRKAWRHEKHTVEWPLVLKIWQKPG